MPQWRVRLRALDPDRPPPDFAVISPIRSGSTDFASRLMLHPSVLPPLAKEIPELSAGSLALFPTRRERSRVAARTGAAVSGYFGPFLDDAGLPEQVAALNPGAKLVLLLPDRVRRAHSHWRWEIWLGGRRARGRVEYEDFDRFLDIALAAHPDIVLDTFSGYPVLESGLYVERVRGWLERFDPASTLVLRSEDYFAAPATVLDRVQDFLELPRVRVGDFSARLHANPLPKAPMSARAVERLTEFYAADEAALAQLLASVGLG